MSTSVTIQLFVDLEVFEDGSVLFTADPGSVDTDFLVETGEDFEFTPEVVRALQIIDKAARKWSGSPIKVAL